MEKVSESILAWFSWVVGVVQVLFVFAHWLVFVVQPLVIPVCFVLAWILVLMALWSVSTAIRDGIGNAKRMHQIPCANCQFFTGDYRLKCPVHPLTALSEAAVNCPDYDP